MLKRASRDDALRIAAFRRFAHELIAREIERAPSEDNDDAGEEIKQENDPPQQTTDLSLVPNVSRPVGSKALYANTPLGPMFTSAVATEELSTRSLPAEFLSVDVLPQIPTSASLLVSAKAPARHMNLGRKNPLVAVADSVAAVKQPISDAALAHGLSKDTSEAQSGSRQTLFPIVNHILSRRSTDTKPSAMLETASEKDTEMQDANANALTDIDEDLINAFEGDASPEVSTTDAKSRSPSIGSGAPARDRDLTATLQRLAQLQADRMRESATKQPTDEELKCAKVVQDALSKQILAAELTPAELLGEGGVRSDYTFVRIGRSYQGTLPSTLNQAVASSQDFMMRLPRMHPLQAAIVPVSPTWASMGAQSSANGTLEQVPVSQLENYAAEPGRHGSVPNLGAFHHPSIASQLLGLASMTSSRPSAPPSSRGPMPPNGMPNGSYPGTPAGPMGAPPLMMTPAGYNSPYAYPPLPPHAVSAVPQGMSSNASSTGSAAPKNYPPPVLATVPGKSKPIKLGPTGKRYYTPRKPNPPKVPGAAVAAGTATSSAGSAGSATPPPPKLGPDGQPKRGPGRPRKDASTPGSAPATPAAPIVPAPPK